MGLSLAGGSDGVGGFTGGGDLRLLPPEHSYKVHCYQAHYGPYSCGEKASGVMGGQAVVEIGQLVLGRDADTGSGVETNRGGGGGVDSYGDRINRWEDNSANIISGKEPNSHIAYDLAL